MTREITTCPNCRTTIRTDRLSVHLQLRCPQRRSGAQSNKSTTTARRFAFRFAFAEFIVEPIKEALSVALCLGVILCLVFAFSRNTMLEGVVGVVAHFNTVVGLFVFTWIIRLTCVVRFYGARDYDELWWPTSPNSKQRSLSPHEQQRQEQEQREHERHQEEELLAQLDAEKEEAERERERKKWEEDQRYNDMVSNDQERQRQQAIESNEMSARYAEDQEMRRQMRDCH